MKKKGAGVKPGESGKTAVFISEFRPNTGAGSGVESSLTKIRTPIFLRGLILVAILAQNIGLLEPDDHPFLCSLPFLIVYTLLNTLFTQYTP